MTYGVSFTDELPTKVAVDEVEVVSGLVAIESDPSRSRETESGWNVVVSEGVDHVSAGVRGARVSGEASGGAVEVRAVNGGHDRRNVLRRARVAVEEIRRARIRKGHEVHMEVAVEGIESAVVVAQLSAIRRSNQRKK